MNECGMGEKGFRTEEISLDNAIQDHPASF